MTIRMFMALLLAGVFALATLGIGVSALFLSQQLLPIIADIEGNEALRNAILQVSIGGAAISFILITLVFFAVGRFVARPIQLITTAMRAFAETGERPDDAKHGWMPKEVESLTETFSAFSGNVDQVHKRDVEMSRVKSDFISTAAHQLRTPLTGIRWALEALQMEQLTESQKALVANAVEKSHQLVAVVGTLLDISSIESGKYKYDMKRTTLNDAVDEIARDFSELAVKAQVSFLFEKSGQPSAVVSIDRERIRWVLNNLVENAIRYTPAGGSVRITTETTPERAYVRIRDTGIGIPDSDRANIFTRFYRAPNAIAKENGGNGLGLYIARTIATDHGGDLNFEPNESGPGTTFMLSLPISA
ncbi:MAG TPA: HAMP domain-containing sensor histidine kinase [Candidatus Paceibacterota bacterium]|nr:HAMP domain-containing sensor histidine kinase [Candidatus Paceibacterota bacterium]